MISHNLGETPTRKQRNSENSLEGSASPSSSTARGKTDGVKVCDYRSYFDVVNDSNDVAVAAKRSNAAADLQGTWRCGRCGFHVTINPGNHRPPIVLQCGLHVLCGACSHFQAGQHCAVCVTNTGRPTVENMDDLSKIFDDQPKMTSFFDDQSNARLSFDLKTGAGQSQPLLDLGNQSDSTSLFVSTQGVALPQQWPAPPFGVRTDRGDALLPEGGASPSSSGMSNAYAKNAENYSHFFSENTSAFLSNDNYLKNVFSPDLMKDLLPQNSFDLNSALNSPSGPQNIPLRQPLTSNDTLLRPMRSLDLADPFTAAPPPILPRQPHDSPHLPHLGPQTPSAMFSTALPPPPIMARLATIQSTGFNGGDGCTTTHLLGGYGPGRTVVIGGSATVAANALQHRSVVGQADNFCRQLCACNAPPPLPLNGCSPAGCTVASPDALASSNSGRSMGNAQEDKMANYGGRIVQDYRPTLPTYNVFTPPSPLNLSPASNLAPTNGQAPKQNSNVDPNLVLCGTNFAMFDSQISPRDLRVTPRVPSPVVDSFCDSCGCFVAWSTHPRDHRTTRGLPRRAALDRARQMVRAPRVLDDLRRLCANLDAETRAVGARSLDVRRELSARCAEMVAAVRERERQLLNTEEGIRALKLKALGEQRETALRLCDEVANEREDEEWLKACIDDNSASEPISDAIWVKWRRYFELLLARVQTALSETMAEDDRMWFVPGSSWTHGAVGPCAQSGAGASILPVNDAATHGPPPGSNHGAAGLVHGPTTFLNDANGLARALRSFGCIVTGASADQSKLVGECVRRAVKCKPVVYNVQTRGYFDEPCVFGNDKVNILIKTPQNTLKEGHVIDRKNGTYQCSVTPGTEGNHTVYICVRNKNISGSPFSLMVRQGRDYGALGARPLFSFGGEGQSDGQFYRPWGVACDKGGRVVISDRGNNRVQIFDQRGTFLTKFGKEGGKEGEFRKPAGVAINANNEIIVVDKDNHRVQVFTCEGKFLFAFGEEGLLCGQFNYPWDCAVNNAGSIAVSDTRNHRIQLFDNKGAFVRKFQFDLSEPRRNLHSNKGQASTPRGLVFTQDGRLLVTDFNHHRLVVIYPDNSEQPRAYGCLGAGNFQFNRPQGVDVDLDGAVLVCDGKNNRCQVFSPQLEFLCSFGSQEVDRSSIMKTPCDLCVTPEGRVFVVDFDNCMIRVF